MVNATRPEKNWASHIKHLLYSTGFGFVWKQQSVNDIQNFEAVIRKSTYGFIQRLAKSTNSLVMAIENSWIVRIDIWSFWQKTLYITTAT